MISELRDHQTELNRSIDHQDDHQRDETLVQYLKQELKHETVKISHEEKRDYCTDSDIDLIHSLCHAQQFRMIAF